MDRPLDEAFVRRRRRRTAAIAAGTVLGLAALIGLGNAWLRPGISRSRVRIATVTEGPIEASISASGTVVPEVERVVSSPVAARIVRIIRRAGDQLKAGDPIVELDTREAELAVARLDQYLAVKANQQARTRLALARSLADLTSRREIKALELESLRLQVERNQKLAASGLVSQEVLRQSEVNEARARIELEQIDAERAAAEQATRTEIEGLDLEMRTLRQERDEAGRQLDLAKTRAGAPGVLTWVPAEEGIAVRKGEIIARIADLTTFRVDATVSDVHAGRLRVGLPAEIRIGEDRLTGSISNILPKIENGIVTFSVRLDEKSSPLLRSNLRVDVVVVTGRKERVVKVPRGPFAGGDGARQVFVVSGNVAVRTAVELGLASYDDFEVVSGLKPGDRVIVSDMRDYLHLKEVRLR
ncbi:MAG: efflux RND transporter periplasmic adaptor subunit [Vicinamibacterales bacterium]